MADVRMDADQEYAARLVRLQTARWKQWLGVQAPFRWNLRRLDPGFTLEIGCGIGRNLLHLGKNAVGVDTNEHCVRFAKSRGLIALTPAEFRQSADYNRPGRFDSILLAHVAEHMTEPQAIVLLQEYVLYLKSGGRLILLGPQEAGFRSDATHVAMMDFAALTRIARGVGCRPERAYSFPFPRVMGRWFTYNEFVVVSRKD
jgi:2-polyprenyl-3-methyl-5-hydroxy-6-metoxy-1,4-benzoquinol methylase